MSQNANTSTNGLWYQHCFDMPRNNAPGKQHLGVTLWQPVGVSCLSMVTLKTIVVGWVTLDRQQKRNFASELEVTACTKAPSLPIHLHVLTTRTGIIKRQVSPFPLHSPPPLIGLVGALAHCHHLAGHRNGPPEPVPVLLHRLLLRGCYSQRASGNTQPWKTVCVHMCACTHIHTTFRVHPPLSSSAEVEAVS